MPFVVDAGAAVVILSKCINQLVFPTSIDKSFGIIN